MLYIVAFNFVKFHFIDMIRDDTLRSVACFLLAQFARQTPQTAAGGSVLAAAKPTAY